MLVALADAIVVTNKAAAAAAAKLVEERDQVMSELPLQEPPPASQPRQIRRLLSRSASELRKAPLNRQMSRQMSRIMPRQLTRQMTHQSHISCSEVCALHPSFYLVLVRSHVYHKPLSSRWAREISTLFQASTCYVICRPAAYVAVKAGPLGHCNLHAKRQTKDPKESKLLVGPQDEPAVGPE